MRMAPGFAERVVNFIGTRGALGVSVTVAVTHCRAGRPALANAASMRLCTLSTDGRRRGESTNWVWIAANRSLSLRKRKSSPCVLAKVICLDCRYGWTENSRNTMLL